MTSSTGQGGGGSFNDRKISDKEGFAIEIGSLEFDFFRWIHMYTNCLNLTTSCF